MNKSIEFDIDILSDDIILDVFERHEESTEIFEVLEVEHSSDYFYEGYDDLDDLELSFTVILADEY